MNSSQNTAKKEWAPTRSPAGDDSFFDDAELNLELLAEECADMVRAKSKIRRFGLDTVNPNKGMTNREALGEELGHIQAITTILFRCHEFNHIRLWARPPKAPTSLHGALEMLSSCCAGIIQAAININSFGLSAEAAKEGKTNTEVLVQRLDMITAITNSLSKTGVISESWVKAAREERLVALAKWYK